MKLLVIETGFAALSVALIDGGELLAEHHELVGRGHAERLMPVIAALLAGHDAPLAILVDAGPGSYTGLRVGIAAARALGLAWAIDVTATTSTALLAAGAFARYPALTSVTSVLDAGRGQVYAETIAADWRSADAPRVTTPAADWRSADAPRVTTPAGLAAGLPHNAVLVGSGAALVNRFGAFATVVGDLPHAADARWLPPARRREPPAPRYLEPAAYALAPERSAPVLA